MPRLQTITPCLWFDNQAEEAAMFYVSVFTDSRIRRVTHYGTAGREIHGRDPGTVMTVDFDIEGQAFTALNGGPAFQFNEAVSFQVLCATQEELDYYWDRLAEGGDEDAQQCGWLKDRFGVSWQVVPQVLGEWVGDPESEASQRTMAAMLRMKKIDLEALRRVYEGDSASE